MLSLKKTVLKDINYYGRYARILKEFIDSNEESAEVSIDVKPISAVIRLREELKLKKIKNVKVILRKEKVYLLRINKTKGDE